jgi:hypothetical protein
MVDATFSYSAFPIDERDREREFMAQCAWGCVSAPPQAVAAGFTISALRQDFGQSFNITCSNNPGHNGTIAEVANTLASNRRRPALRQVYGMVTTEDDLYLTPCAGQAPRE